jgi:Domain of unknown function (DUF6378)/Domain of unknown function (DUF4406)
MARKNITPQPKVLKGYLSGPMTGYDNFNFDAFNEAAADLREVGYEIVNPAESHGGDQTLGWADYLSWDLDQIRTCDFLVMLDGWQSPDATGARLEMAYALAFSLPIYDLDYSEPNLLGVRIDQWYEDPRDFVKALNNGETWGWKDPRLTEAPKPSALIEAEGLVNGPRADAYDHPMENFGRIVGLWNALLAEKLTAPITEEEHAMMMMLVKMARLLHTPGHRDSYVDIAGYAGTYEKLAQRRQEWAEENEVDEQALLSFLSFLSQFEEVPEEV